MSKPKSKAEEAITKAVRYLEWPAEVTIPPGCGLTRVVDGKPVSGGPMSLDFWFVRLVLEHMSKAPEHVWLETEALRLLGVKRKTGAKVEIPETVFQAVVAAYIAAGLASRAIDLYLAQRPLWVAFASAPSEQPANWSKAA